MTTRSRPPTFEKKQPVVHISHGVGTVLSIDEEVMAGFKQIFYVVSIQELKLIVKVPVATAGKVLREIMPKSSLKKVFSILKKPQQNSTGKWMKRNNVYVERLATGDIYKIAAVVRDLRYLEFSKTRLNYSGAELYKDALRKLTGEVSAILEKDSSEALTFLETETGLFFVKKTTLISDAKRESGRSNAGAEAGDSSEQNKSAKFFTNGTTVLKIDTDKKEVTVGNSPAMRLTKKEKDLLFLLAENNGNIVSLQKIAKKLYGNADKGNQVQSLVCKMRKKLRNAGEIILASRGNGYHLPRPTKLKGGM